MSLLQQVKPRTAKGTRALKAREPQDIENPKTTLFLRGTKCSEISQHVLRDLFALKRPLAIRFTKKNPIHPFEDASSLEFFSSRNDASLFVFGSSNKKRPHALTFVRCFEHKVLDMMEVTAVPETLRTMSQFKNARKPVVGAQPLVSFSGTPFESPVSTPYTLAKSLLLDFFKGPSTSSVDVQGLQYLVSISAADETDPQAPPPIHIRCYLIRTKASGSKFPRVEVEEMGPRIDFRIGRTRVADSDAWRAAMQRPKSHAPKAKKNIETDLVGDQLGRIHVGRQNLNNLQTRKMKGLKRSRDLDGDADMDDGGLPSAPLPDSNGTGNAKRSRT